MTNADVLSNPLFDDPSLRLTPRLAAERLGIAAPPAKPAAATAQPVQRGSSGAGLAAAQAWAPAALAPPSTVAATAALVEGYPVSEALPLASFPAAAASAAAFPAGPGGLSILYENQAMRMERAELKSELKLISARVSNGFCQAQRLSICYRRPRTLVIFWHDMQKCHAMPLRTSHHA